MAPAWRWARPAGHGTGAGDDPQTSGGLLVACAPDSVAEVLSLFAREALRQAAVIGGVQAGPARLELR
jgi:selenide,water dikinase